ncbi:MAG: NAD(P)/FAD-dependent oxidoreductase, partial [Beijerinckiaceae bacterium]
MRESFDVVIAGGAVMGSSIACHLAMKGGPALRVLVVEPDPSYARSASALSAGSIRQQFSTDVNIDISLHGIEYLRNIGTHLAVDGDRPDISLHEGGYLYVASAAGEGVLREVNALQRARGANILHLACAGLAQRFPWLSLDGVAAGNFGVSGEGWFDGYGLMMAFRRKARALGVTYRKARVSGFEVLAGRIASVVLETGERIACGAFVNAAGASGARLLSDAMGFAIPVRAKKRCVFSFSTLELLPGFPLLIDTSGVWVRP